MRLRESKADLLVCWTKQGCFQLKSTLNDQRMQFKAYIEHLLDVYNRIFSHNVSCCSSFLSYIHISTELCLLLSILCVITRYAQKCFANIFTFAFLFFSFFLLSRRCQHCFFSLPIKVHPDKVQQPLQQFLSASSMDFCIGAFT